jgi:CNT family concentrative nucleoside transporter
VGLAPRLVPALGLLVLLGIAWACSSDRRGVPWRTVATGLGLQLALAALLLKTAFGRAFFDAINLLVAALTRYTRAGVDFVFGAMVPDHFSFALEVLPIIVFMGSVFAVLYHVGAMQRVVDLLAFGLSRTMGTSGAESLSAVANVFLGPIESALVVRPYLERMTRSELFLLMTLGMATVAGSVLVAYVGMLGGGDFGGHLATATLIAAPAGILVSKLMVPETGRPETATGARARIERSAVNAIDAAAEGALAGLRLAACVGALLVAFVALIALLNDALGLAGGLVGHPALTLQGLLGALLSPLAWLLGVPWEEAPAVGALIGVKTVLNEFLAYADLSALIQRGALSERSAVISAYALCGFANFGSLAILLGGIGGLAPGRRAEVAELGLRSILAGSLASFMTACVAAILI